MSTHCCPPALGPQAEGLRARYLLGAAARLPGYRQRFPREDAPGAGHRPVQEAADAGKEAQA